MLLEQVGRKNGMFRHVTTSQRLTVNNSDKYDESRWRQTNPKSTRIAGPPPRWGGLCLYLSGPPLGGVDYVYISQALPLGRVVYVYISAHSHTTIAPDNKIAFSFKYRQTFTTTLKAVTKLLKKLVLKT